MDAAHGLHNIDAGTEVEMVGVDKIDLGIHRFEVFAGEGFDDTLSADRHEDGGIDDSMWGGQASKSGGAVGVEQFEFEAIRVAHSNSDQNRAAR